MATNKSKGDYYRRKTMAYMREIGYSVITMEYPKLVFIKGKMVYFKQDVLGADLLAYTKKEFILVQVKLNKNNTAQAKKEFAKYDLPPFIKKQIFVWIPRIRMPTIYNV